MQWYAYIRRIGDQLPEEDLFVGIEGVDDEGHQLSNLCLEGKGLNIRLLVHFFRHLHTNSKIYESYVTITLISQFAQLIFFFRNLANLRS